jgi:hypothetical protein
LSNPYICPPEEMSPCLRECECNDFRRVNKINLKRKNIDFAGEFERSRKIK